MASYKYDLGGSMKPDDASEGIAEFDQNRTLLVQKLTGEDPVKPEITKGLRTVDEVFEKFQPNVDCEFEKADGSTIEENISFSNVGDFSANSISKNSEFLNNLTVQNEQYLKILKKVKSNKILQNVMNDPAAKEAFINSLKGMLQELIESEE